MNFHVWETQASFVRLLHSKSHLVNERNTRQLLPAPASQKGSRSLIPAAALLVTCAAKLKWSESMSHSENTGLAIKNILFFFLANEMKNIWWGMNANQHNGTSWSLHHHHHHVITSSTVPQHWGGNRVFAILSGGKSLIISKISKQLT